MVRTKHENISVKLFALLTLCLCTALMMYLPLAPACAMPPPTLNLYVVDAYPTPGAVYRIQNRKPSLFFRRGSGNISSIALYEGQLFFCSTNDKRIYQRTGQGERVVFEHGTYVRDIAVDPNGNLCFSEASGTGGDGRIHRLRPPVNDLGPEGFSRQSEEPFYIVEQKSVDGRWDGDFTFDAGSNLYLSSGKRTPASIYKANKIKENQYGPHRKLYQDPQTSIKGIAIDPTNPNFAYYADWKQTLYKFDINNSRRSVEFSENVAGSRNPHLSDVAFDIRIKRPG